ncbi:DISARM system helicase DrmA [Myxococcota bacterium]|nr:DISARM system helicase DrmA [Myxococcota bacterium]
MSSTPTRLEVRDHLVQALAYDLVGPMREDELLPQRPTRWYLTGFLVPRTAPEEQKYDPLADEDLGGGLPGDADDDHEEARAPAARVFFPSSLGLSVIVPEGARSLTVTARWGEYARLPADESETLRAALEEEWGQEAAEPEPGDPDGPLPTDGGGPRIPRLWRREGRISEPLSVELHDRTHKLPGGEDLRVVVRVRPASAPGLPAGARVVSVFLVNERVPVEGPEGDERCLFQVGLEVGCDAGFLPRPDGVHEGSDDPDQARTDLQYRDHGEWAVGHGVATRAEAFDGGPVRRLATTWFPQARIYRLKAESVPGVPVGMGALAALPDAGALTGAMAPLLDAYGRWIAERRAEVGGLSPHRRETALALMERATHALSRIREGLEHLAGDPLAFEAFRLTNRAMEASAERARPGAYGPDRRPEWRLFQLAFLLLNVPSVADPRHPDRGVVELLFFPTGGGKTEAYFGVAAFAMLLRRLRGQGTRHGGAGVTVLLRYTLRLLTLDQLGRAATLTCALERLRREDPERLGRRRFSVGLWVGQSATPNKLADAESQVRAHRLNPADPRKAPPVPLVGCPWCQTPFVPESFQVEKDGKVPRRLKIGCPSLECDFGFSRNDDGLPIVVVDEQIYRELPAFLIATVDKFALLPWRGEAGSLFGRVKAVDPWGFYGAGQTAPSRAERLPDGIAPPELVIQDELHLITGPLGTMVGLYETAIGHLSRGADGVGPKIVASTATARRAQEQVRALFARSAVELFPPQGIDPDVTFFARSDLAEEKSRLYVGIAAPGRSMKAVMVRVYSTLLSAAYRDWYGRRHGTDNPGDTYCTLVAYFNTLRELGGAQRLVLEEVAPRSHQLERRRPVQERTSPWFRNRLLGFDVLELTSRQSTDAIRKAKAKLEAPFSSDAGGKNDVLLASSMISVGVDIPRLGLMVMNGQPRTVAEYIQATSRVGRETPGLVVTLHNLYRARDRSHFERFTAFHEAFYRKVEASSVTPFSSRAIDRGLAGVVVALARHGRARLAPPRGVEHIDDEPGIAAEVASVLEQRVVAHRAPPDPDLAAHVGHRTETLAGEWSAIASALAAASVPLAYSPWEGRDSTTLLRTAVDPPSDKDERLDHFRAPTSMRDVEPTVHFWLPGGAAGREE